MPRTFPGDTKLEVNVNTRKDQDAILTDLVDFLIYARGKRMKLNGKMQDRAFKHFKTFAIIWGGGKSIESSVYH